MTKKLAELLELASDNENVDVQLPEQTIEVTEKALTNLEKIENALPQVRGLEIADNELDELASLATASYKDLLDLGMQVEAKYSSEIFSSASTFLGHAITAKVAKINKKLKTVDLQLKTAVLEQKKTEKSDTPYNNLPVGEVRVLDRNELLNSLLEKKSKE
jgi:hypothetical protein